MSIKISIIANSAMVSVNDLDIATFCCVHMAQALAGKLGTIRDMPYRTAMKTCMSDLGCCEKTAEVLIAELHDQSYEKRTVQ